MDILVETNETDAVVRRAAEAGAVDRGRDPDRTARPSFLLCLDLASTVACGQPSPTTLDWYERMMGERRIWAHPGVYEARLAGIANVRRSDSACADRLAASVERWWDRIPPDQKIRPDDCQLVLDRVRSNPRLQSLVTQTGNWRTTRGLDVTLAAAAIHGGLVLATEAPGKPEEISRHERVPGVYCPDRDEWPVKFRP